MITTKSEDPLEIAELLMDLNSIPMLGCENAWITAGALMAALKNEGTAKVTNEQIDEALNRTKKQAIGGYCGLTGVCGIAPAIGACFSVIFGATCSKDRETATTMRIVARILGTIANETGPCCCKNFVRKSLVEATKIVKEQLCVSLPLVNENIACKHSDRHPHGCRKEKCSYFGKDTI
nr:DUF5714 domain-containing protein [Desulfosporosinus fructosivorans]